MADEEQGWAGAQGRRWAESIDRFEAALAPFGDFLVAAARVRAGERVLEVGCGAGATALRLARTARDVVGLDISPDLIAQARARVDGHDTLSFAVGDAGRVPLAGFDLVVSQFGLMFFDRPLAALRNIRSGIRPGGRLVALLWRTAEENPWWHVPYTAAASVVDLPAPDGGPGPFSMGDSARTAQLLEKAGFSNVTLRPVNLEMAVGGGLSLDDTIEFLGTAGVVAAAGRIDSGRDAEVRAVVRDALAPHAGPAGVMFDAAFWLVTADALFQARSGVPNLFRLRSAGR